MVSDAVDFVVPEWASLGDWSCTGGTVPEAFMGDAVLFTAMSSTVQLSVDFAPPGVKSILRLNTEPKKELGIRIVRIDDSSRAAIVERTVRADPYGIVTICLSEMGASDALVSLEIVSKGQRLVLGPGLLTQVPTTNFPQHGDGRLPIFAGIATIPTRIDKLAQVVADVLPQVDRFFVFLNDFIAVPDFLCVPGITVIRSQDFGDWRDNSKFFGLYCFVGDAYYVTVDDDIFYPENYVAELVEASKRHYDQAVVGYHAVVYGAGSGAFKDRAVFHFERALLDDMPVNVLGTGTTAFHTKAYRPDPLAFEQTGMVDLIVGSELERARVPMISVARSAGYLRAMPHEKSAFTLFSETKIQDSASDQFVRNGRWNLEACSEHAERHPGVFCRQALILMGYERLLRSGVKPSDIAVLPVEDGIGLAERINAVTLRSATFAGACFVRYSSLSEKNFGNDQRWQRCISLLQRKCELLLSNFVLLDVNSSDQDEPYRLSNEDVAELSARGLHELVFLHQSIMFMETPSQVTLGPVVEAATVLLDQDLYGPLIECLQQHRPLSASEATALSLAKLQRGDVDSIVKVTSQLLSGGFDQRVVLATAAISAGLPWAGDLVLRIVLDTKYTRKTARKLHGLLEVLRNSGVAFDVKSYASALLKVEHAIGLDMVAALASRGYWDVSCTELSNKLPPHERVFWEAKGASIGSCRAEVSTIGALNSHFLARGLVPVFLDSEDKSFFASLAAAPVARLDDGQMPLVSIIVTAFNSGATIDYAIKSVLNVEYPNFEIVVVDDFSDIPVSIDSYVDNPQRRSVRLVRRNENGGPYASRNSALEICNGEYIAIHDADDWIHPQKLERQIRAMQKSGAIASYTKHVRVTAGGELAFENNGRFVGDGPVTSMFHRSVFRRIGRFSPARTRGDLEFKARLVSAYGSDAIAQLDDISVIALDSQFSNSKISVKTWKDVLELRAFKQAYELEHPVRYLMPKLS